MRTIAAEDKTIPRGGAITPDGLCIARYTRIATLPC